MKDFIPISKRHLSYDDLKKSDKIGYYIYILYLDNKVYYIGKSVSIKNRLVGHWRNKHFDTIKLLKLKCESDMHILEPYLISKLKPEYNVEFCTNEITTINIDIDNVIEESIIITK